MVKSDSALTGGAVVAMRLSALGDVAMTIPALYDAALASPGQRFVMVTRSAFKGIFLDLPANLTVVGIDPHAEHYRGVKGMWRLFRELRRDYGMTCFIDLHDVLRSKMIRLFCRLAGIRRSVIDKGRADKKRLTRDGHKMMEPLRPMTQRYRDTFLRAGLPCPESFAGYEKPVPGSKAAEITGNHSAGEHLVGIAPFARHRGKIYPTELMEQVVAGLMADPSVRIILFGGGGDEAATLSAWAEKYGQRVMSLAGKKLGFEVELGVMSLLDCMVSMDSGNMHLASLAGTSVVSVWGATHPYVGFGGWRQDASGCVQLPLECRPCSVFGDKPCKSGDYRCMTGIAPEVIISKIRSSWK